MPDLYPAAEIRIFNDQDLFGYVSFPGESATWSAPAQPGRADASVTGFCRDQTGEWLRQYPVYLFLDAGLDAWTPAAGASTTAYGAGTDETTGKQFLRSRQPASAADTTFNTARVQDESFFAEIWRADAAGQGWALYFSEGAAAGVERLRLVLNYGEPIRLEASTDGATWTMAAACELGNADTYLKSVGQRLTIEVESQSDAAWDGNRPLVYECASAPPNRVVVALNGQDAVLTYKTTALAAGALRVVSSGGRWDVARIALVRYTTTGGIDLAPVTRPTPIQGSGTVAFHGWRPYAEDGGSFTDLSGLSGTTTFEGNVISASVILATPEAGIDATGYALRTVLIGAIVADYPFLETLPVDSPAYTAYRPTSARWQETWDEGTRTERGRGVVTFADTQGIFAPGAGGVLVAVRAFELYLGYTDPDDSSVQPILVATGYTGMEKNGFSWAKRGGITYVTVSLSDRLIMAETRACGYLSPVDGTDHFWAQGRYAKRAGFTNAHLPASITGSSKYTEGDYHLPYGTATDPVLQPRPSDMLAGAMEEVRKRGGQTDSTSGTVQPMILGVDSGGTLVYQGLPVGVIDAVQNQIGVVPTSITPVQNFSAQPEINEDGTPKLNEFLSEFRVWASLTQIRSSAVFEGIDQNAGGVVVGFALNSDLYTNPNLQGYIGAVPSIFTEISVLISDRLVAERLALQSDAQLTFPAVSCAGSAHLQGTLGALSVFTATDFDTLGTNDPVAFFANDVTHHYELVPAGEDKLEIHAGTDYAGRLLGQAGD